MKNMKHLSGLGRQTAALLAGVFLLAGCQAFNAAEVAMQVDAAEARVTLDRFVERPGPLRAPDTVQTDDGIWLGGNSVRIAKGDPLPRSTDMVTLISAEPLGIQDIATEITTLTGIPVLIDFAVDSFAGAAPIPAEPTLGGASGFADAAAGGPSGFGGGSFVEPSSDTIQLSYSGPLGGLLDLLSTRFNTNWEYKNNTIRFFELETRVFTLLALASILDTSTVVGTTAEGEGETGGFGLTSSIDASRSTAIDLFNEIAEQVVSMVGTNGQVAISPSSGTLSVSARPHVLDLVADFVTDQNEKLSRQITLNVQVLSIQLEQSDTIDFDLSLFLENALQVTTNTPGTSVDPISSAGAISALVLDPVAGGSDSLDSLTGSRVTARAIASEEKASLVNSVTLVTTNGMTVPFQQVTQTRFIAEVEEETEEGDDGNDSTTITATVEDLITGFSIEMTPKILADGGVILQYAINLSELISLVNVQLGLGDSAAAVQIPTVDVTSFIQQAIVRSGQTLALAGFEEATNDTTETGQGIPENIALGGSKTAEVAREVIVVLITPKIQDSKELLRGDLL